MKLSSNIRSAEAIRETELAEQHQLKPLLAEEQFGRSDIARAYDAVAKGSKGKVVLEL